MGSALGEAEGVGFHEGSEADGSHLAADAGLVHAAEGGALVQGGCSVGVVEDVAGLEA